MFAALAPADFENADPWATPMCATYAGEVVTQSGALPEKAALCR